MHQDSSSLLRLQVLKDQIRELQEAAAAELVEKRSGLMREVEEIDEQIEELSGKPASKRRGRRLVEVSSPKGLTLEELKELLAAASDKTLNIRKEKLALQSVKSLVEAHPQLLKIGGKGAWPTIALVK